MKSQHLAGKVNRQYLHAPFWRHAAQDYCTVFPTGALYFEGGPTWIREPFYDIPSIADRSEGILY